MERKLESAKKLRKLLEHAHVTSDFYSKFGDQRYVRLGTVKNNENRNC